MWNNKNFKIFIISSSLPIFFITFSYIGYAIIKSKNYKSTKNIHYELFPILIPLFFGIAGIINYHIIKKYNSNNMSLIVGAIFGLILSTIGRFYLKLPTKIFNFTNVNEWHSHIIAFLIYSCIFRFIMTPIQLKFKIK